MREIRIERREAGQRLDKYLKKYLDRAPSSFLYRMLRKKQITLNGKRAEGSDRIADGDVLRLFLSEDTIRTMRSPDEVKQTRGIAGQRAGSKELPFVYEDADIVIANKPAGMLSQPAPGGAVSAAELLPELLLAGGSLSPDDLRAFHPAPLNRLDRNTSGLLLCAKSVRGAQLLSELIRGRALSKEYLAVSVGRPVPDGRYEAYALRDEHKKTTVVLEEAVSGAQRMVTTFHTLDRKNDYSLIRAVLVTGRTHQIRAQLAALSAPVAGDPKYGCPAENRMLRERYGVKRQLLHAERVTFPELDGFAAHLSGRSFAAPPPDDVLSFAEAAGLSFRGTE